MRYKFLSRKFHLRDPEGLKKSQQLMANSLKRVRVKNARKNRLKLTILLKPDSRNKIFPRLSLGISLQE